MPLNTSSSVPGIAEMPRPAPGGGMGLKLVLLALVILALLGAAAYWLTRSPDDQKQLREDAASGIDNLTEGTLLSGLGNTIRQAPPPSILRFVWLTIS